MSTRDENTDKFQEILDWADTTVVSPNTHPNQPTRPVDVLESVVEEGKVSFEFGEDFSRINDLSGLEHLFVELKMVGAGFELLLITGLSIMKARQLGQKPPELNTLMRVSYLLLVLLLSLGLLVFTEFTSVILITLASVALVSSLVNLGKTLLSRYQLYQKNKELPQALAEKEQIQKQARHIENNYYEIAQQISALYARFQNTEQKIQELKLQQPNIEKQRGKLSVAKLLDRSLSTLLCTLSLIGFGLMLTLPPLGATIVFISTIAGLSYTTARLAYVAAFYVAPKLVNIAAPFKSLPQREAGRLDNEPVDAEEPNITDSPSIVASILCAHSSRSSSSRRPTTAWRDEEDEDSDGETQAPKDEDDDDDDDEDEGERDSSSFRSKL